MVILDLPVTFSLDLVAAGQLPYTWNPAHPARVGLLPRVAAQILWVEVEPASCSIRSTPMTTTGGSCSTSPLRGAYDVSLYDASGPLTLDRWIIDPAAGR